MSCPTDCSVRHGKDTKVFYKQHSNCGVLHLNISQLWVWRVCDEVYLKDVCLQNNSGQYQNQI